MEELCLLSIFAEASESMETLRNELLYALHRSKENGMLIVYGTVLCKLDTITDDEYKIVRELNAFSMD